MTILLHNITTKLPNCREILLLYEPVRGTAGNDAHNPLQDVAQGGQQPSHLKIKSRQE